MLQGPIGYTCVPLPPVRMISIEHFLASTGWHVQCLTNAQWATDLFGGWRHTA
ncbi:hypothetical protein WA016_03014 [Myxococcus stipitatus]